MVHAFRQSLQDALHECTQKVSMKTSYKELVDSRNHAELHWIYIRFLDRKDKAFVLITPNISRPHSAAFTSPAPAICTARDT